MASGTTRRNFCRLSYSGYSPLSQRPQDTHMPSQRALAAERSTLLCGRPGGLATRLFPLRPGPSAASDMQEAQSDLSPSPLPPLGHTGPRVTPHVQTDASFSAQRLVPPAPTLGQGCPHAGPGEGATECPAPPRPALPKPRGLIACPVLAPPAPQAGTASGDEGLQAPWRAQGPETHRWARSCSCRAIVHDADSAGLMRCSRAGGSGRKCPSQVIPQGFWGPRATLVPSLCLPPPSCPACPGPLTPGRS